MRLRIYVGTLLISFSSLATTFPASQGSRTSALESLASKLPSCAFKCFVTFVPKSKCALTDVSCLCTDTDFIDAASSCILSDCTVREALVATRIQKNACGFPVRDQSGITRGIEWSFFGVAVIAVVLRLLARSPALGGHGYGWDDSSILLCLMLLVPLDVMLNLMLDLGLGKDVWTLKPSQITTILFYFWVEEFIYTAVVLLTKVSIVLLYLRLFPATERWFRRGCLGLIALICVTFIPGFLTVLFQCNPIDYAWLRWDDKYTGTCISTTAQITAFGGINIFEDILVFGLPIPRLVKLNISRSKKVAVLAVFLVGLFVTICSAIRLQYLVHWGKSKNPTWEYNPLAIWSSIECNLGVGLACMPTLAGPMKRVWKGTIGSRLSSSESDPPPRRRLSSSVLREVCSYFKNQLGSKAIPTFVLSQRRLESTDEVELVDRDPSRPHERSTEVGYVTYGPRMATSPNVQVIK